MPCASASTSRRKPTSSCHRILDRAIEASKGKSKVGTTGKGIGPAYTDKVSRTGLRVGDILDRFEEKYQAAKSRHLATLKGMGWTDFDGLEEVEKHWMEGVEYLKGFHFTDSEHEINHLLRDGKSILCEGAQGTMLDVDFGSYPFVTSSNTIGAGACTGLGIGANKVGNVFGIMKAYSSCVGEGPFTCELFGDEAHALREAGGEYGAATGRPRRVGGFDVVASRYGAMMQGCTCIALTKLDVMSYMDKIPVCVAYELDGKRIENFPGNIEELERAKPIYEYVEGFKCDISGCRKPEDLPKAALDYVKFIEKAVGCPIKYVSVSAEREGCIEMF